MSSKKITLTGRRPVSIDTAQWPLVAYAGDFRGGNGHECQANEVMRINVREHNDGRILVYGFRTSGPGGMPLGYNGAQAGVLLGEDGAAPVSDDAIVAAIRQVADDIDCTSLAAECIADLPAREL